MKRARQTFSTVIFFLLLASFGYLVVRADTTKPAAETNTNTIESPSNPTQASPQSPESTMQSEKAPVEQIVYVFSAPTGEVIAYNLTKKNSEVLARGPGSGYVDVVYSNSELLVVTRARENSDLAGAVVDLVQFPKQSNAQATVLAESVPSTQPPSVSPDRSAYLKVQFDQTNEGASFTLMKNPFNAEGPSTLAQEKEGIILPQWAQDGKTVYYITPHESQYLLKRVSTASGDPVIVGTLTQPIRALRVSGERILVALKLSDVKTGVSIFSPTGQRLKDYGEFDRILTDAYETPNGLLSISRAQDGTHPTLFLDNSALGTGTSILGIE